MAELCTTYELYLKFIRQICQPPRVESLLKGLILEAHTHTKDPIAYVALKFLQEPLTISLIDRNLCLFKSDPTVSVPFNALFDHELELLRKIIECALEDDCLIVREQRGGAHCLLVLVPLNSQQKIECPVLLAAVLRMLHGISSDNHVASVVMQRLKSACVIHTQNFTEARRIANEWPTAECQ